MQRQRWMEERRHVAFDELSKTLQTELAGLSSSTNIGQPLTFESSNSNSNTNLVTFFESSQRRTPIRTRTRRRMPLPRKPRDEQPDDSRTELPRSHHQNHIIPLVLKAPQQRRLFPSYIPQSLPAQPSSSSSVEDVSSTPSTTSDTSNLETIEEDNETVLHIPANYNQDETDGTALIWREAPRSKEEILAKLDVSMPDYVTDLLAGFVSTSRPRPITLPTPTSFTSPPPPPPALPIPRKPIQKSSSRHRLGTLFSGIPETFTSRLTNTNGSDTTKTITGLALQPTIDSVIEGPSQPFVTMAFSDLNTGNSGSQAPNTELQGEKIIVRIRRRISNLGRT